MIILDTHSSTSDGNDCLIRKDITLAILNDEYVVLESTRYSGWNGNSSNTIVHNDDYSEQEARKKYSRLIADT